jgi:hypothetical protein
MGKHVGVSSPEIIMIHRDSVKAYLGRCWASRNAKVPAVRALKGHLGARHSTEIRYAGNTDVLDACIIGDEIKGACSTTHVIAGVTCRNARYVYNGWTVRSSDPAM